MNIFKQTCLDSKTLMVGNALLTDEVKSALTEVRHMNYTNELDIICIQNCIEEWDTMTAQDQEIVYCILANVYSVLIDDVDQFITDCYDDGVTISYCDDTQTFIPTSTHTNTLDTSFVKC